MQHLLRVRERLPGQPQPVYIDCRATAATSGSAFASTLLARMRDARQLDASAASGLLTSLSLKALVTYVSARPIASADLAPDLHGALDAFAHQAGSDAPHRALLIVDAAQQLMAWDDRAALRQLLNFCVWLTKQEQRAHVVLATNEARLPRWLDARARPAAAAPRLPPLHAQLTRPLPVRARRGRAASLPHHRAAGRVQRSGCKAVLF